MGELKIAHFLLGRCNPESANGIDKTVYHLSAAESARGHEVRVYSLTSKKPIPIPGAHVSAYPARYRSPGFLPARFDDWFVARSPMNLPHALIRDLFDWRPDLLHLHFVQIPQNIVLARYARKRGVPYCVSLHGGLAEGAQRRHRLLKALFRGAFERRYLESATFLHALSQEEVLSARRLGISNAFVVAPNGIDSSTLPVEPDRSVVRRRFPELAEKTVAVFLGRLDPDQKGLDQLLQALASIGNEDLGLLLIGPDWRGGRGRLEEIARDLRVPGPVCYAGASFGDEKWDLLAGSDVFVHPSRWEGVSLSVLEAAAIGLPLLVSERADPLGRLAERDAAIVVAPGAASVAEGLRRFLHMPRADRQQMGQRARETIQADFSWDHVADAIVTARLEAGEFS